MCVWEGGGRWRHGSYTNNRRSCRAVGWRWALQIPHLHPHLHRHPARPETRGSPSPHRGGGEDETLTTIQNHCFIPPVTSAVLLLKNWTGEMSSLSIHVLSTPSANRSPTYVITFYPQNKCSGWRNRPSSLLTIISPSPALYSWASGLTLLWLLETLPCPQPAGLRADGRRVPLTLVKLPNTCLHAEFQICHHPISQMK